MFTNQISRVFSVPGILNYGSRKLTKHQQITIFSGRTKRSINIVGKGEFEVLAC